MLEQETGSPPRSVILVHKGGLGDFLQVWPSLYALTRHWPETAFFWAGREAYSLWTEPLGIRKCPGQVERLVNSLYSAPVRPEGLGKALLIWFGLKKAPFEGFFPGVWFVPGITGDSGKEPREPPRKVYAQGLAGHGIVLRRDWLQAWRRLIGAWSPDRGEERRVLLFPGAGNCRKCWPVEKFQALGEWLCGQGWIVSCVYGPAEKERGLRVKNFEPVFPEHFQALQLGLAEADLVVGNDCGPLHLAGYLGVPSLALFGPADPQQWGPSQVKTLSRKLACSPCTELGEIHCPDPVCLLDLSLGRVQEAVRELLQDHSSACDSSRLDAK